MHILTARPLAFLPGVMTGTPAHRRWPKIDWIGNTAPIDRNWVSHTEKVPKTAAGIRTIDLENATVALIDQKAVSFLSNEHIWLNPCTAQAWESDAQVRKTLWQPLYQGAGMRYRNPYQTRHTYASAPLRLA